MLPFQMYTDLRPWQSVWTFSNKIRVPRWWLMAVSDFTFYGDESGSHHDPNGSFVLSGYLASDDVWGEFEPLWHEQLQGGKAIEWFHMQECFKLEDQFSGFNRPQANRKLNDLVDVLTPFLRSKRIVEHTAVLDWAIYDRAISGPVKEVFHNPYLFLIGALQAEVTKHVAASGTPAPVYFFLDEQSLKLEYGLGHQFYRGRRAIPENFAKLLHGLTFKDDKYCYPLQAADLIAWQRHRRELNLAEDSGGRKEFKRLHNAACGKLHRYREDGLMSFCQHMEEGLKRESLLSSH